MGPLFSLKPPFAILDFIKQRFTMAPPRGGLVSFPEENSMRKILLIVGALGILASCSTLDKQTLTDPSLRKPFAPTTVKVGFDTFMFRLDIQRGKHEEYQINSQNQFRPVLVDNPYSPLVIDLGNGLIYDANGNLGIDILRYYGFLDMKNVTIVSRSTGFGGPTEKWEKMDNRYRIERSGVGTETGTYEASETADDKKHNVIKISPKGVVDTIGNILGITTYAMINTKGENEVAIPGLIGETVYRLNDGNRVDFDNNLSVINRGDTIQAGNLRMIQTQKSVFVYYSNYRGFELRRDGAEIRYLINGKLNRTYTVE